MQNHHDRLAQTISILGDLIAFPTISTDPNREMIDDMAHRLEDVGARVEIFPDPSGHKANLFATLGPEGDGGIVLSGHSDVVPVADQDWSSDPFKMVEREGRLYGRGSCDMKGFLAACLAMAPAYATLPLTRPLHFAFTHDEESGCFGALSLVETLRNKGLRPAVALIGEPTMMRVIEGHKGCYEYTTHFTGLAGHGSAPQLGVNAVEYAARYVGRLLHLKDALRQRAPADSAFDPPWTTINTGRLEGGVAHNVIPSHATLNWEMRPVHPSDAEFVKADLADYVANTLLPAMQAVDPKADITTETVGEVVGLIPTSENEARAIMTELTGANATETVAFGTEAGIFQELGLSAVVCGPGSIEQAHKADEYVSLDQLSKCLGMLDRLQDKLIA